MCHGTFAPNFTGRLCGACERIAERIRRAALRKDEEVAQEMQRKTKVRDLPDRLDLFCNRLRVARIPFKVRATATGYGVEVRHKDMGRANAIWLGTKGT
jgi:hypothetical protein